MSIEQIPAGDETPMEFQFGDGLWLHFTPHVSVADATGIDTLLARAEVYIPEIPLAADRLKKILGRIAKGDYDAYQRYKRGDFGSQLFIDEVVTMMFNRPSKPKLSVEIVDVPPTVQWGTRISRLQEANKKIVFKREGLDATLENDAKELQLQAAFQVQREAVIVDNLAIFMRGASMDRAGNRRVLMTMGSVHTTLLPKLAERGIEAHSTRDVDSIPLPKPDELVRQSMVGESFERTDIIAGTLFSYLYITFPGESSEYRTVATTALVDAIDTATQETIVEDVRSWAIKTDTRDHAAIGVRARLLAQQAVSGTEN